ECSLAGIVRALEASRATGVRLVVGSEFVLDCGLKCVLLVETASGYTRLCELVTHARRAVEGQGYRLARADVERRLSDVDPSVCGLFALWIPGARPIRSRAAGCAGCSANAPSSPWSCTASRTTRRG